MKANDNGIIVSSWKGWTYGVRLLKKGWKRFLSIIGSCTKVVIELEDTGEKGIVNITSSFYKGCHELRGKIFKTYFERNGLTEWERGKPYKLRLVYIGVDPNSNLPIFRLEKL